MIRSSMVMTFRDFSTSKYINEPHCLLLGHPVEHSLSPVMHNTASRYFDLTLNYIALDVTQSDLNSLPPLFNERKFIGANVTIPYKQQMRSFVDETEDSADKIGAINTIYKNNGKLLGGNTDAYGFSVPLQPYNEYLEGERAVIFGTGGASRAVVYALDDMGMEDFVLVSRNPDRHGNQQWPAPTKLIEYSNWTAYAEDAVLIVNTTPLGMHPEVSQSPVRKSEKKFLSEKICYDLVYNPRKTRFLTLADQVGATAIGGLEMLIYQGSRSFEYWTGKSFPVNEIQERLEHVF